ncbi:MAG: KH domain-containing protein [Bacillota bacterium]
MRELVDFLVGQIVEKDSYEIVMVEDDNVVEIKVFVDQDKVAKIIGKSGRIAKSIRTLVKAASQNSEKKYDIYIEERK